MARARSFERLIVVVDSSPASRMAAALASGLDCSPARECRLVGLRRGMSDREAGLRSALDEAAETLRAAGWRVVGSEIANPTGLRRLAERWQPDAVVLPAPGRMGHRALQRDLSAVVHAELPWYAGLAFSAQELFDSAAEYMAELREARLGTIERMALRLSGAGVAARTALQQGSTADVALRAATERRTDLIVVDLGSGGPSGPRLATRHARQVTDHLVRAASCSVLVLRGAGTA